MMRASLAAVIALISIPLSASTIRFDPPNPDSRTPVVAHVIDTGCVPVTGTATRNGQIISIATPCAFPFLASFDIRVNLGVLPPGLYEVRSDIAATTHLPVTEADPAFRIEPNVVPVTGGEIRILGNLVNCAVGPSPIVCGRATVRIDGVESTVKSISTGVITVQALPHVAGVVDVRVETDSGTFTRTAALHYFEQPATPDPAFFERMLLPVSFMGPGAYGSLWQAEAAMFNGNDYAIDQPTGLVFTTACFPVCDFRPQPGTTSFGGSGPGITTGLVFYVPRQAAPKLQFSLVVRDLSRDSKDYGTSVPVVREREMFDRKFTLVNVPSDARYRLGLRLYAYDTIPTTLHIDIAPLTGGAIVSRDVPLLPARDHAFVLIGDLLAEHPALVGKGPLRIDITALEPGTRAWGYVSVTNNETQHVTTIAPE